MGNPSVAGVRRAGGGAHGDEACLDWAWAFSGQQKSSGTPLAEAGARLCPALQGVGLAQVLKLAQKAYAGIRQDLAAGEGLRSCCNAPDLAFLADAWAPAVKAAADAAAAAAAGADAAAAVA